MALLHQLKRKIGLAEEPNRFECRDCDTTFESHMEPDSYWLSCERCDSEDVELIATG